MATLFARMAAGLGLFFLGLHLVSANLQQTSSRRFRQLIARVTDRSWLAGGLGVLAGAVMQSTSAVTIILASMTASGLTAVRQALPVVAWANVGATLIVFAAVLDLRLAVLYLVGVSATAFSFSRDARWKPFCGIALGIGLLFFGIDQMKENAAQVQQFDWFLAVVNRAHGSVVLAFLAGALLSFLTHSTTAVTLLAVTLVNAGVLAPRQTMMIIYGGNLGSSFSRMILASGLRGSARQISRFQDLFKITGAVVFVSLFYLEAYAGVPLVHALAGTLAGRIDTQMAWVNLLYNLVPALGFSLALGPTARLLERFWPATEAEDFARLRYLHPQALGDVETALDLVEKEQARLVARLPDYLRAARAPVGPGHSRPLDYRAVHQSFAVLAREVESYCTALFHHPLTPHASDRLTNVQNRHEVIGFLEDGVYNLATAVQQTPPSGPLDALVQSFVEALEFLLRTAAEATASLDPAEAALLGRLCADRGELLGKIRTWYLSGEQDLSPPDRTLLLTLTTSFDRIVWMVRRLAVLLEQNGRLRE
jgi:phosphate:Na+ symporter